MGNKVIIHGVNVSTHIILEFTGGEDQTWLIKRAKELGVKVYSTMPFWYNRENCPKNTLLIGFSRMNRDEIVKGITLLNKAWFDR
jgi:GntR family transcriptional regulator/MocR family aminotransferase